MCARACRVDLKVDVIGAFFLWMDWREEECCTFVCVQSALLGESDKI